MDFFKATDGKHWYASSDSGQTFRLCKGDPFPNGKSAILGDEVPASASGRGSKPNVKLSREQLQQSGFAISKIVCEEHHLSCSFEGNGNISDAEGNVVWQLATLHRNSRQFWFVTYGILRDPGCSLVKTDGGESLMVARERQFPLPRFVMTRDNERVCTISQRSPLFNTYLLEFSGGQSWVFRMPLFNVNFQGLCDEGGIVYVREWTKRQWLVLSEAEHSDPLLLCALAFIHRERLRFA